MPTDTASLLREARLAAGLTQAELARRASTSQPAVASYEGGKRTPGLSTLTRLLAACGRELALETRPGPPPAAPRSVEEILRACRDSLLAAAAHHGVRDVRVFGSTARGDATGTSDVDLLVKLDPGRTLIDLAAFRIDAQAILGVPVDVATLDLLKTHIRPEVAREASRL